MNVRTEKRSRNASGRTFKNDLIFRCLPLATVALLGSQSVYSQDYTYRFKLEGVTTPADAKMITDALRTVFNHPETPFAVFPKFYDETDVFFFQSNLAITREELDQALSGNGTVTAEFSVTNGSTTGTNQTEKE